MINMQQRWYCLERARVALDRARAARDPAIAIAHFEFYEEYMRRAGEVPQARPTLRMERRNHRFTGYSSA